MGTSTRPHRKTQEREMSRGEIIEQVKVYFKIQELVSKEVYEKYGDASWFVLQTGALVCLLLIRVGIGKPITVNTWHKGGRYDERGYRDNLGPIVVGKTVSGELYVSGHVLGCAFDFKVKGWSACEVRTWIEENAEIFPCKIRLERQLNGKPITWVHIDTKYYEDNPKVYLFDL